MRKLVPFASHLGSTHCNFVPCGSPFEEEVHLDSTKVIQNAAPSPTPAPPHHLRARRPQTPCDSVCHLSAAMAAHDNLTWSMETATVTDQCKTQKPCLWMLRQQLATLESSKLTCGSCDRSQLLRGVLVGADLPPPPKRTNNTLVIIWQSRSLSQILIPAHGSDPKTRMSLSNGSWPSARISPEVSPH